MEMKLKNTIKGGLFALGMAGVIVAPPSSALGLDLNLGGIQVPVALDIPVPLLSVAMDFEGWVTMLWPDGHVFGNYSEQDEPNFQGARTPIKGKMIMEMGSGGLVGTATFDPFLFLNTPSSGHDVQFYAPNALLNALPTNTLLLGNMRFDFGTFKDIPVSIVLDIGGLTTALKNTSQGKVLKGILTAASDNTLVNKGDGAGYAHSISMGPVLVATTTLDTTDIDTDGDGQPGPIKRFTFPSGTTPLIEDAVVDVTNGDIGIGGSPMKTAPFPDFNPNFDIVEATVTCFKVGSSCNTAGLPMPPLPTLSAQPLEPLLQLIPE
jgi:hypothetical protein